MSKITHILIISSWYPTNEQPFLGNFVQRQAELLAREYKITVLNTVADDSLKKISVEKTQNGNLCEITVRHPKGKSILRKRREQVAAFANGMNLIDHVNLIIGHVALPKSWQFIEAKKRFNCPLFYIEHGSYFRAEKRNDFNFIEKYLLKQLKKRADEIIAVSDFLKKDMELIFSNSDIKVIGNHVDEELFSLSPEQKNSTTEFLHISTLDEQTKNPKGIIIACSLLKKEGHSFHLTIVSDEDSTKMQEYAKREDVFDRITFVGPLKWEETVAYYHKADAFILFSYYETFSIVLAESWMTGTPTISTPVGIAFAENKDLGIAVENNNAASLKNAMARITAHSESLDSNVIREFAKKYSSDSILQKWQQLIEKHAQ
ncbi:MAG: glycosyltransferase family 4 protein [Fluviicola sp.]|nr:glycosyltransferase family 4 protein [Fluviicola sp.]